MGTWGVSSYSNDSVMDAVGGYIDNPTQEEADRILDQAYMEITDKEMYYHFLGCVVWFLDTGCNIKIEYLEKCANTIIPYEIENNGYRNRKARIEALEGEMKMIKGRLNKS